MIQISGISISFGSEVILHDTGLFINKDERIGIIGRNGSGKSTLFNLISQDLFPDEGTVSIPKNYQIGRIEQEIAFTAATVIDECLAVSGKEEAIERWRGEKMLAGLGFPQKYLEMNPRNLSGGYQVRLCLARVLLKSCDLLLLDEPTNYLDIISIRWLERYLTERKGELLLITHDRSVMDAICTHTAVINRKKIKKYSTNSHSALEQLRLEEVTNERTIEKEEKKLEKTELFIRRFRAKARLAGMVQSRIKALEKKAIPEKLEKQANLYFHFSSPPSPLKTLLTADSISFRYGEENNFLFENLRMQVKQTDRIIIIGRNGRGKSTLCRVLAGMLPASQGCVRTHTELCAGYFGQDGIAGLDESNSVEQEIAAALPEPDIRRTRDICGMMMFSGDAALKKISVLSGGEKARVLLGKLLAKPHHMLILDEPTNHLDMPSNEALLAAIAEYEGAVILVTHNEYLLHSLQGTFTAFTENQNVISITGTYKEYLEKYGWNEQFIPSTPTLESKAPKTNTKRLRAEIIQERSRVMAVLQKKNTGNRKVDI